MERFKKSQTGHKPVTNRTRFKKRDFLGFEGVKINPRRVSCGVLADLRCMALCRVLLCGWQARVFMY